MVKIIQIEFLKILKNTFENINLLSTAFIIKNSKKIEIYRSYFNSNIINSSSYFFEIHKSIIMLDNSIFYNNSLIKNSSFFNIYDCKIIGNNLNVSNNCFSNSSLFTFDSFFLVLEKSIFAKNKLDERSFFYPNLNQKNLPKISNINVSFTMFFMNNATCIFCFFRIKLNLYFQLNSVKKNIGKSFIKLTNNGYYKGEKNTFVENSFEKFLFSSGICKILSKLSVFQHSSSNLFYIINFGTIFLNDTTINFFQSKNEAIFYFKNNIIGKIFNITIINSSKRTSNLNSIFMIENNKFPLIFKKLCLKI